MPIHQKLDSMGEHNQVYSVYFTQVYILGMCLQVYDLIPTQVYKFQKLAKVYSGIL